MAYDDVTISIQIEQSPFSRHGAPQHLRYVIGREQALDIAVGRRPPDFDMGALVDWNMRRERAESMARHIAADLAHKMIAAFNPTDDR